MWKYALLCSFNYKAAHCNPLKLHFFFLCVVNKTFKHQHWFCPSIRTLSPSTNSTILMIQVYWLPFAAPCQKKPQPSYSSLLIGISYTLTNVTVVLGALQYFTRKAWATGQVLILHTLCSFVLQHEQTECPQVLCTRHDLTSLSSMEKERKHHPSLYWQWQGISEVPQGSATVLAAHLHT